MRQIIELNGANQDPDRPSAWEWLSGHKNPELLPTPWLTDTELEDFTETLLLSQRLLGPATRYVVHIERWGVSGDKQDGIDFFGKFSDGTAAAWQVKQLSGLTRRDVRLAVSAAVFKHAEEFYLVFGGVATVQAREEMLKHTGWTLLDRRTLTEMLHLLPPHTQRSMIERFWGPEVRRHFLVGPGDAFIPFESFRLSRLNPSALINDLGDLAGREVEIGRLMGALELEGHEYRQIIVVSGPGGRGKSRVINEVLELQSEREPTRPIICLSPMRAFDTAFMNELHTGPCVVLIDDAHLDPSALRPLLGLIRSQPQMQIVLASRPSGIRLIRDALSVASFSPDEQLHVAVGELDLSSARRLVSGLSGGLELNFSLRNYLADQARHSPHVAVILTNLIRRGQMSGSIAVNDNLRQSVMARYQEVLLPGDIEGVGADVIRRFIATYACLQPVEESDDQLRAAIAAFCGLVTLQSVRLVRQLTDRGVLLSQEGALRVVPDVLADQIVEEVAVVDRFDTGFVSELWQEFGHEHHHRLALALGELDWRVRHRSGAHVMSPVWDEIRRRLQSPYPSRLMEELTQLQQLAATQPASVVAALEELRKRLDDEDAAGTPLSDDPEDSGNRLYRRLWPDSRRPDRADVRAKMPELYGRAAAHDPKMFEVVVDALLELGSADQRPPHSYPEHARRILSDRLCNLATLPDASFPQRMVDRVQLWCNERPDALAVAALKALKPLLAKEELETTQSALHTLSFQSHQVSPEAMRSVRDQIRRLVTESRSASLHRAGVAVSLLGEAIRPPRGYFGASVPVETVLSWEGDDLESIRVLADITAASGSAVLRRHIRDAVEWSAEHAESIPVQHAALTLSHAIDGYASIEDAIAARLVGRPWGLREDSTDQVPDLKQLEAKRAAESLRTSDLTEEQLQADQQARIRAKVEYSRTLVARQNEDLAARLIELGDATAIVSLLDSAAREAEELDPSSRPTLRSVWQAIGVLQPDALGDVADVIAHQDSEGPLDRDLPVVIACWYHSNSTDAIQWATNALQTGRKPVRLAVASLLAEIPWDANREALVGIWTAALGDLDDDVVQAFLGAAGWYFHALPAEVTPILLKHGLSTPAAAAILIGAWRYGDERSLPPLDESAHRSMLAVVARAGLADFIAQETLVGIAKSRPILILDFLLAIARHGQEVPDDIHDLAVVFDDQPEALSQWLETHLDDDHAAVQGVLVGALNGRLSASQASAITTCVGRLDRGDLIALVQALGAMRLWVLQNPALADAFVDRAEAIGVVDEVVGELRRGMILQSWSSSGGTSEELDNAYNLSASAASTSLNVRMRSELTHSASRFKEAIDELAREERAENEAGW